MSARHLDEGALGWVLTAAGLLFGVLMVALGVVLGRAVRLVDDQRPDLSDD